MTGNRLTVPRPGGRYAYRLASVPFVLLLLLLALGAVGCTSPPVGNEATGQPEEGDPSMAGEDGSTPLCVMAQYGPLGPVPLSRASAESVMAVWEDLQAAEAVGDGKDAEDNWVLQLTIEADGTSQTLVVIPSGVRLDERLWPRPEVAHRLAREVRLALFTGSGLAELLQETHVVRVGCSDVAGAQLVLDTDQKRRLAAALAMLTESPVEDPLGPAPYPGYEITMDIEGLTARLGWTGSQRLTFWSDGVYTHVTLPDDDSGVWKTVEALVPVPSPLALEGLGCLFAATGVRAAGGDLRTPLVGGPERVPGLVRLLRRVVPANCEPQLEEDPVTITFHSSESEWTIDLYRHGFVFQGRYYPADDIQRVFLRSLAG